MRQSGFGLIEMMIALVLGMIVIGAALGAYLGTFSANSSQMKYSRLNNDLRTVITQITRDLRRAGYNPGVNADNTNKPVLTGADQIAITYYVDDTLGATIYGYRLSGGAMQSNEDGGTWVNLTDPAVITIDAGGFVITEREVTVPGSRCVTIPEYEIVLTGHLTQDGSVVRSIRETVRPRNEVVASDSTCL